MSRHAQSASRLWSLEATALARLFIAAAFI
jgi:hypothetical protein